MTERIECTDSGERLDVFLAERLPGISRNGVQRLLDSGCVTLAGKPVRKNHRVSAGEIYYVAVSEPEELNIEAQDIPLDVVYEDSDVIVVNKPRGMVVHPAPGHSGGTLVNALLRRCGDSLSGIGGVKRPGIVHRIDKDTSGLLIAAKNDFAHIALASQLAERTLTRIYEAVVCGTLKNDCGTVNAPIGRHPADRKRQTVTDKNSRAAVTHYEVIARYNGFTHVRCRLETGRTHQIRVHMAHIGHPVLGDPVYGHKKPAKNKTRFKSLEKDPERNTGQCLHAKTLKFIHPRTGETVTLTSELPEYFTEVLDKLKQAFSKPL